MTPKQILKISEPIELLYMTCSSQLVINLCGHFATGKDLPTQEWEIQKLSEMGALTEESIEIIAAMSNQTPEAVRQAISEALKIELADVENVLQKAAGAGNIIAPAFSWQSSGNIKNVIQNLINQAGSDLNIVNTTMLQSTLSLYTGAISSCVDMERKMEFAQQQMNQAAFNVATGTESRVTALRRTIRNLAEQGVTGFIDKAGRHWSPEAYVNMDIRTTVHNAAVQGQRARSAEYGVMTFQISSHAGARPLCAPYQGKFYSWDNTSGTVHDLYGNGYHYDGIRTTSYGQAAGIFGINCGHRPQTFVDGYNIPRYEPTTDFEENARIYEETQRQRYMERQIRNEKTQAAAFQAAGDEEAAKECMRRAREKSRAYRDYCEDHELPVRTDRTRIVLKP